MEASWRSPKELTETDTSTGSLLWPGQVDSWAHLKLAKETSTCQSVRESVRQHTCERDSMCACVAFLHVKCQKLWAIA